MLNIFLMMLDTEDEKSRFVQLYHQYRKLMHYEAKRILKDDHLAEDAVQEAFLRIAKNFHKVGEIFCPQTKNFTVIIVRNAALTMIKGNFAAESYDAMENWREPGDSWSDTVVKAQYDEAVQAIRELPEIYRHAFYLHEYYGYDLKETANLLGITVENAKKRAQRARKLLRERLENDGDGK